MTEPLDLEGLLARMEQRQRAFAQLCDLAGADPDAVRAAAELCSADVEELARRYPDDWWPRLRNKSAARRSNRYANWVAMVHDAFRQILANGDGPVSALDLGIEGVRACVHPPSLLAYLDQWEPRRDGGIVLWGKTETGKTMAALALAWRLHEAANVQEPESREPFRPVRWVQASTLARCRECHRLGTEPPALEVMCSRAPVLVLDDLLWAGHRVDAVLEVLGQRLDAGLATVTTTGFDEDQLRQRLGDAGLRRLLRVGAAKGRIVAMGAT